MDMHPEVVGNDRYALPPQLEGDVYCSPWCGFKCAKAAYDRAVKEGDELAERMGDGWTSRVWENGGWHYEAVKGVASVGPRLDGSALHDDWRIVEYVAIINSLLHGWATAETPEDAMGFLLQDLRAKERLLSADLAVINE